MLIHFSKFKNKLYILKLIENQKKLSILFRYFTRLYNMKQHMEHCVGAAFVPRAMTCYLCDMQFASIAGYKQHMEHAHNADDAATSYNQSMDARYAQMNFF